MIVQVAPVEKNVSETTCSLSFGQRVRNVELGMASSKMDLFEAEVNIIYLCILVIYDYFHLCTLIGISIIIFFFVGQFD